MTTTKRARSLRRLSAEQLEARKLLAVDLQQLGNINDSDPFGAITESAEIGDHVFFIAPEPGGTRLNLWITDGTSAGTTKLADVGAVGVDFGSRTLTNVGGTLFFQGTDDAHGRELWKSDGTAAGTLMVKDLVPGPTSSNLSSFLNHNGTLLLSADGELTRSDGQAAGTFPVVDLQAGQSDEVANFTEMNGEVFFTARRTATGHGLFKTDGTAAGTASVQDTGASPLGPLENISSTLYFVRDGNSLWQSDGTGAGTALVTDFQSAPFGARPYNLTNVSGELFFTSYGELWKSDGTAAGTVFLKNAGLAAFELFDMDGRLFFSAGSAQFLGEGYELWTSDGTAAGTFMVKDLAPDFFEGYGDSSSPSQFTNLNGTLYFTATESNGGRPLWTSDGTAAGTVKVEEGFVNMLYEHSGGLLFSRMTTVFQNFSLWKTDGTPGAAVEIPRLGPGAANADPGRPIDVNGTLYFVANDGEHGHELWKLVGDTPTLVKDINPGPNGSGIMNLTNHQGTLFFTAFSAGGYRVWQSNGTAAGTVSNAGASLVASPQQLTSVGNQLFFSAFDGDGWELWKSGPSGTVRVKDINPGSFVNPYGQAYANSSFPANLVNLNGTLYFGATSSDGRELWKSDGTEAGTVMVKDIFPGFSPYPQPYAPYAYLPYASNPSDIVNLRGTLYFAATTPETGRALWKSDGTAAGTVPVRGAAEGLTLPLSPGLTVVGRNLFFKGHDAAGDELWKSDGTTNGTVRVKDIRVGPGNSYVEQLTNVDGKLYFVARDGVAGGKELWQSDGTEAGTYLVKDIRPGLNESNYPRGSDPASLVGHNGVLYFTADDGVHGRELWRTNGNGDAVLVEDLVPGSNSSTPQNLFPRNNTLFFSAATEAGRELWQARSASPVLNVQPKLFTHTEDGAGKLLAATALLSDADTSVLAGGKVRVSFSENPSAGDRLSIAANEVISTAGNVIYHKVNFQPVAVGTFSGGGNGAPLVIELNQNATVDEVQALIRSIHYRSESQHPSTLRRTIRFEVTDGEGARATFQHVQVDVVGRNDAPVLNNALNPSLGTISEDVTNPAGILVRNFASAGISDPDGDPKGIAVTAAGRSTHGQWQFSLDNGVTWQTLRSELPLSESAARLLPANATTRVRFVPNLNINGTVQLFYRAWDGTQGAAGEIGDTTANRGGIKPFSAALEVATLTITATNDKPVLTLSGSVGYAVDSAPITLAPNATLADPDGLDFDLGQLIVRIGAGAGAANRLEIGGSFTLDGLNLKSGDTVIGTLNENGGVGTTNLVVTFNSQATKNLIQQLVRSITFKTVGGAAGQRKVLFSLTDGDGGFTGGHTKTVNVT